MYDSELRDSIKSKTEMVSPCEIPFEKLMTSDVIEL